MNTLISKITASVLALSLTLISSVSLASSCGSHSAVNKAKTAHMHKNTKAKLANQSKKTPSFMFVIDAKKGQIKKDKNGQYHLILKKVDMNQVIMFSDRPQRIVKYITGKDLQTLWKEGKNSFKKDPPNAVLSGKGITTQIVILRGVHVSKSNISMPISINRESLPKLAMAANKGKILAVTLTVDQLSPFAIIGMALGI